MYRLNLTFFCFLPFLLFQMQGGYFPPPYPFSNTYPQNQHRPPLRGHQHLTHNPAASPPWPWLLPTSCTLPDLGRAGLWLYAPSGCSTLPPGDPPGTPSPCVRLTGTHSLAFLPHKVVQDDSRAPALPAHPGTKEVFLYGQCSFGLYFLK